MLIGISHSFVRSTSPSSLNSLLRIRTLSSIMAPKRQRHSYDLADKSVNPAWQDVDDYLEPLLCTGQAVPEHESFDKALRSHAENGIPGINVSPLQGMYLYNTALALGLARGSLRVLEVGTLAGYSTLWLAKAIKQVGGKDTRVISLEFSEKHAKVARRNIAAAGYDDNTVKVITGDAKETMKELAEQGEKFDLIFIDADKPGYSEYWKSSIKMSKKGTLIIADNVVRQGRIAEPDNKDENVVGVRDFLNLAAKEPNVTTTVLSSVNGKGWDGFTVSTVHQ